MKLTFEINEYDLVSGLDDNDGYYYEHNNKTLEDIILDRAVSAMVEELYNTEISDVWRASISKQIEEIIKNKQNEICEKVIERLSDKIAKKKIIVEQTPKARELSAINKDNEDYFIELIDKAIAKRFK